MPHYISYIYVGSNVASFVTSDFRVLKYQLLLFVWFHNALDYSNPNKKTKERIQYLRVVPRAEHSRNWGTTCKNVFFPKFFSFEVVLFFIITELKSFLSYKLRDGMKEVRFILSWRLQGKNKDCKSRIQFFPHSLFSFPAVSNVRVAHCRSRIWNLRMLAIN